MQVSSPNKHLTRQSLPDEEYIRLLGVAISIFASNNGFVIENILHTDPKENWYILTDKTSGKIHETLEKVLDEKYSKIINLFGELVEMRNRIIHGFRITSSDNEQILATKDPKTQKQFNITKDYLYSFIEKNDLLSKLLYDYRKAITYRQWFKIFFNVLVVLLNP